MWASLPGSLCLPGRSVPGARFGACILRFDHATRESHACSPDRNPLPHPPTLHSLRLSGFRAMAEPQSCVKKLQRDAGDACGSLLGASWTLHSTSFLPSVAQMRHSDGKLSLSCRPIPQSGSMRKQEFTVGMGSRGHGFLNSQFGPPFSNTRLKIMGSNGSDFETDDSSSARSSSNSASYSTNRSPDSKASRKEVTETEPKKKEVVHRGPWLIVGLGNPEKKYGGTRHNVGFEVVDSLARAENIPMNSTQNNAIIGKGKIGEVSVLLAKPQTYMNLSGQSVAPLANFYKIPPERILVVFDDMSLDLGVVKLLLKGGHGGQNGMRSIIDSLNNKNFPRLRIGIGKPPGNMSAAAFVLQKFNKNERDEIDVSIAKGVEAIQRVMVDGIEKTISMWGVTNQSFVKIK